MGLNIPTANMDETFWIYVFGMAMFLMGNIWGMMVMIIRMRMFGLETPKDWYDLWRVLTVKLTFRG